MTEQIMKILPEKKEDRMHPLNQITVQDIIAEVHNKCVDDCAAAIEKANLVRCPSEVQIRDIIRKAFDLDALVSNEELMDNFSNTIWEMFVAEEEATKAILALLRGEK